VRDVCSSDGYAVSDALGQQTDTKASWDESSFSSLANLGLTAIAGDPLIAAGSFVLGQFLPTSYTFDKITLGGQIVDVTPINAATMTLPGDTTFPPFYARADSASNANQVGIGLFTLTSPPKLHLHMVEDSMALNYYRLYYYPTIDDPQCDLVVNPNTDAQLTKILVRPVIWKNDAWVVAGNLTSLQKADDFSTGPYWLTDTLSRVGSLGINPNYTPFKADDIAGYFKSESDIKKEMRFGVDVYVEFKNPKLTGDDVFTQEKVFEADLDLHYIPDGKPIPSFPQFESCPVDAANRVASRGVKHRNLVTNVSVTTGSSPHANTDANVSLVTTGCDGFSETAPLITPGFTSSQQDSTDQFTIPLIMNHGPLQKIAFVVDNNSASWQIANFSIMQTDLASGQVTGTIEKNTSQWIESGAAGVTTDYKGNLVWEYANPSSNCVAYDSVNASTMADYSVKITTANVKNAETDAVVTLHICGIRADNSLANCFNETISDGLTKNGTKELNFRAAIFSQIQSVSLIHDASSNSWRAEDVTISVEPLASGSNTSTYTFPFRQWINKSDSISHNYGEGMGYKFKVLTGDVKNAGTNADIYAHLCDSKDSLCVNFKLDNETMNDNEQGDTSVFTYYSTTILNTVGSLTLYSDNDGRASGWKPYSVNLERTRQDSSGSQVLTDNFWYDQWLAYDELEENDAQKFTSSVSLALDDFADNGTATLSSGLKISRSANRGYNYNLTIHTADSADAGTSANVWARIVTNKGSYDFKLDSTGNMFERNDTNGFHRFRDADADPCIQSISLMHDATHDKSGWLVDWVKLSASSADDSHAIMTPYSDTWNAWIGKDDSYSNSQFTINNKTYYGITKTINASCPDAPGTTVTALRKSIYTQGDIAELTGFNLGTNAAAWSASLGGAQIPVLSSSNGVLRLSLSAVQSLGSQTLAVSNGSTSWTGQLDVQGPLPSLTAISNASRKDGEYFELLGRNFGLNESAIQVKIGSVTAPLARLMDGRITLLVPSMDPGTYTVSLTVNGRTAPQTFNLIIESSTPKITSLSATTVAPGATLAINGSGFGTDASKVTVILGTVSLVPASVSGSQVTVVVPAGFANGIFPVKVTRNGLTNTENFSVEVLQMPDFLSFDSPQQKWYSNETTLSRDVTVTSTGSGASLNVAGSGYRVIRSPRFNTAEIGQLSDTLALDVFIPSGVSNSYWLGQVQFFVDAPAAGVYNAMQASIDLTSLSVGAWHTLRIPLSADVVRAIEGDYPNMEFDIVLNAATATDNYRFDQLRFVGSHLHYRTLLHKVGSRDLNVSVPTKLGFESSDPWTVPASSNPAYVADPKEEGQTALSIAANGFNHLVSPQLHAFELTAATNRLNVDVFVPDPQPNQWWVGNLAAYVDCPADNIYNQFLGQKDLTQLFRTEYNGVQFDVPTATVAKLKNSVGGCQFSVDLNVNNGPAPFLLDKMGFVQASTGTSSSSNTSSSSGEASSSSTQPSSSSQGSSFVCTGMCLGATVADVPTQAYTLNTTGDAWFVLSQSASGWQGSEMAGRTVEVNGVAVTLGQSTLPPASGGKWYFHFSSGDHSWASWSWWK